MAKRTLSLIAISVALCTLAVVLAQFASAGRHEHEARKRPDEPATGPSAAPPPRIEVRSLKAEQVVAARLAPTALDQPAALAPASALSEAQLMEELRHAHTSVLAIRLARQGNQQFPGSDFAPERESILIHALADNQQQSEARGEAEYMVNHYPDSEWVREIERFTGAHRHRNVRLNEAGEIEYQ